MPFFNHTLHAADAGEATWWQRREFLHAWWSIYRDDARWTPPTYGRLKRALDPGRNAHLKRLRAALIHIDALHRTGLRRSRNDQQEIPLASIFERPLAAAVAVIDPRGQGRIAYLALPQFSEAEALDRLYYHLVEVMAENGIHRLVGPTGLSPHLGSGLLIDGWDEWPPLHTPINPPYAPELIERRLRPFQTGRLYRVPLPLEPPDAPPGPAVIRPFDPARLAGDLLPLLVAATDNPTAAFPPPDVAEAAFLLAELRQAAPFGYLAEIDGAPAGFMLMGADVAPRLRAARGGRPLWGRALLELETRFFPKNRVSNGRVYFGAVLPSWRRQGVGRQLWGYTLGAAVERGWATLTVGPVWRPKTGEAPAIAFLEQQGAVARQGYRLYEATF
jgi:GNAT superfamily N-acetyltransferase